MIDWAASSPVVDWPTEPEFAEWMAKRGEVNTEMTHLIRDVLEEVSVHVAEQWELDLDAQIPAPIRRGIIIEAYTVFRRRQSPEGIAGGIDGVAIRFGLFDQTALSLMQPYLPPKIGAP